MHPSLASCEVFHQKNSHPILYISSAYQCLHLLVYTHLLPGIKTKAHLNLAYIAYTHILPRIKIKSCLGEFALKSIIIYGKFKSNIYGAACKNSLGMVFWCWDLLKIGTQRTRINRFLVLVIPHLNLDCDYIFPIDLGQNGIPFGAIFIRKV